MMSSLSKNDASIWNFTETIKLPYVFWPILSAIYKTTSTIAERIKSS